VTPADSVAWRHILQDGRGLSAPFRERYARVLAALAVGAVPELLQAALSVAASDPRRAARILLGLDGTPRHDHRYVGPVRIRDVTGDQVTGSLRQWLGCVDCLECLFGAGTPLHGCRVPLHPDRAAVVVPGPSGALVALRWDAGSVPARQANRQALHELTGRLPGTGRTYALAVPDVDALVWPVVGDPWALARHHGRTLEDALRDRELTPGERRRVVATLAELRAGMLDTGLIWQGFAPRNMFLTGEEIVLIDFEECVELDADPVRAAGCLLWHQLFFADCLTTGELRMIFAEHAKRPRIDPELLLTADPFESALLGAPQIEWQRRESLLRRSTRIEGRHRRPAAGRDHGVLHGHELGHFWGDFVRPEAEAMIFHALGGSIRPERLVEVLEVFEAAMEADIDAMLRADAAGEPMPSSARTAALAEVCAAHGPGSVAECRRARQDWYPTLLDDPAALVDGAIADLTLGAPNLDIPDYLIGHADHRIRHTAHLIRAVHTGLAFLHADGRDGKFLEHADTESLKDMIGEVLPSSGADLDDVLAEAEERLARYSISQSHPGYLAFPDSGNSVAALAGGFLARLLNQNLIAVDRSAPAATFVTVQVIEWLRELVGYDTAPLTELAGVRDVAGLWTSGGHMSNHVAMLTALGVAFPEACARGLHALPTRPVVVMAGPIAHYSHSDAAFHLGLGWDSVITVPALPGYTTDPVAVERVLADPPPGVTPFMVVGVAGNCRTTGLDDLTALADVCARHGVWLHADACHGGSLIFDEHLRTSCLAGIERADSVSLDPHKGLFTPYSSSYVVFKERGRLSQFSRHAATVRADGCWDLGLITPFVGSAGFEALPTWMLLKHVGTDRLGRIVAARMTLVRHLQRRIDDTGLFVRLHDVDFYRLAFVFCPPQVRALLRVLASEDRQQARIVISRFTSLVNDRLYRAGRVCFDEHTLPDLGNRLGLGAGGSYTIMACCPGNPLTTISDLDAAIAELVDTARPMVIEMVQAVSSGAVHAEPGRSGPAGWGDS